MENHIRFVLEDCIQDELTGDYINPSTGEIFTVEEMAELFPGKFPEISEVVCPTVSEAFENLKTSLESLVRGFGSDWQLVPSQNPDMIVGETDLTIGAGTDSRILPTFVEEDYIEANPVISNFFRNLLYISTAVEKRLLKSESLSIYDLEEISEAFVMKASGIMPLGVTAVRYGPLGRRLLVEKYDLTLKLQEHKVALRGRDRELRKLKNDLNSLKGIIRSLRNQLLDFCNCTNVKSTLDWQGKVLKNLRKFLEKFKV